MKKFLLLAGEDYYPGGKTDDWIGCFATREEAESVVIKEPWEYNGKTLYHLKINGVDYVDWYEIADLEEWMNK
jgi:hypothetical protein